MQLIAPEILLILRINVPIQKNMQLITRIRDAVVIYCINGVEILSTCHNQKTRLR